MSETKGASDVGRAVIWDEGRTTYVGVAKGFDGTPIDMYSVHTLGGPPHVDPEVVLDTADGFLVSRDIVVVTSGGDSAVPVRILPLEVDSVVNLRSREHPALSG